MDALGSLGFNPVLELGAATETVEVTTAPPVLDTTNATVGLVMENQTYANLPLQMNNAQRDATAFASLAPGAQAGTRVPIVGGTGNYLGQLYIDGMPAETINQQGDNRIVSQGIDLDAVDQFQVVTSTPPAEYSGAGALNFTMKSGGNKYHGQVSDFVRNTAFDTWGFTAKWLQQPGVNPTTGVPYPICSPVAIGSDRTARRLPAQGSRAPERALRHLRRTRPAHAATSSSSSSPMIVSTPAAAPIPPCFTVPTQLMVNGDFTSWPTAQQNAGVIEPPVSPAPGPTTRPHLRPHQQHLRGSVCTRTPFQGIKNGIPTNNIIPASYLSPIRRPEGDGVLPARAQQYHRPDQQLSRRLSQRLRQQRRELARRL